MYLVTRILAMFIDTHAHIHANAFDADRAEVIKRALAAGVSRIINVGFDVEDNFKALALANKYEFIYAALGIHPHLASQWNDQVGRKIFDAAKKESKIVAMGEMGIDYYRNFQPADLQKKVFQQQLKLARELSLPVIIHCRDAFDDVMKILQREKITRAVFHCFTGTVEESSRALAKGFFIGFTGVITYKSASILRLVAKSCPIDKILLETDCPYLAPQKYRGQRNEPGFVAEIYDYLATVRKMDAAAFQNQINGNAAKFFTL